ncbi:hypothetical protein ZWY2020_018700 [Hordeum vulgare]|nr:hypothetical protein ZWY2020_018700 [Hordeum vulgare]
MSWGRRKLPADYVICNVLPNGAADDNDANTNDDSDIHEQHRVFDNANTDLITPKVDNGTIPESRQFYTVNENFAEHGDDSMGEQWMQSPAAASTSIWSR